MPAAGYRSSFYETLASYRIYYNSSIVFWDHLLILCPLQEYVHVCRYNHYRLKLQLVDYNQSSTFRRGVFVIGMVATGNREVQDYTYFSSFFAV